MKSVADDINFMVKHRCLVEVIDRQYYQSTIMEINNQTYEVVNNLSGNLKTFLMLSVGRYIWDRAIEKA